MDKREHLDVTIIESDLIDTDARWNHKNITSPFNRLYFIFEGEGVIESENNITRLQPGYSYLIPLDTTNNYSCSKQLLKYYCHFGMKVYHYIDIFKFQNHIFQMPFDQNYLKKLLARADTNSLVGVWADFCKKRTLRVYSKKTDNLIINIFVFKESNTRSITLCRIF